MGHHILSNCQFAAASLSKMSKPSLSASFKALPDLLTVCQGTFGRSVLPSVQRPRLDIAICIKDVI